MNQAVTNHLSPSENEVGRSQDARGGTCAVSAVFKPMSAHTSNDTTQAQKSTDQQNIEDDFQRGIEAREFGAEPIRHGASFRVQLDDDNAVYEALMKKQRDLNNDRGEPAQSGRNGKNAPHRIRDDASPPWATGEYEVGFYSSKTGLGRLDEDGHFSAYYDQRIQLYDDVTKPKTANTSAKVSLVVEKRSSEMSNKDGEQSYWTPDTDGERHEGTLLKIDSAYVQHRWELLNYVDWLLAQVGVDMYQSGEADIIEGTFRVVNPETHIRYDDQRHEGVIETLRNVHRLTATGDQQGEWKIQEGVYQIWGYDADRYDRLGFDFDVAAEGVYAKAYKHRSAAKFDRDDARHHPKLELKSRGTYHIDDWQAAMDDLNDLLLSLASWSGVTADDLIADDHFEPEETDAIEYDQPYGYRAELLEEFKGEKMEREVAYTLHEAPTKSYYDILYLLSYQYPHGASYQQLADDTGLTPRGVRRAVAQLVDRGLLVRKGNPALVTFAHELARSTVKDEFDNSKTPEERRDNLDRRKDDREQQREAREDRDDTADDTADDSTNDWPTRVRLDKIPDTLARLHDWHTDGRIQESDVSVNPEPLYDSVEQFRDVYER